MYNMDLKKALIASYRKEIIKRLHQMDAIFVQGDFDYDVHRKYPFVRLDPRLAFDLYDVVRDEGFKVRKNIVLNYQAGNAFVVSRFSY